MLRLNAVIPRTLFVITRLLFIVPCDPVDVSDKVGLPAPRYCVVNYLMTTK